MSGLTLRWPTGLDISPDDHQGVTGTRPINTSNPGPCRTKPDPASPAKVRLPITNIYYGLVIGTERIKRPHF
jgi:hypothetical protein